MRRKKLTPTDVGVIVAAALVDRARRDRPTNVGPTEDIIIEPDGTVRFVYSDALAAVFDGEALHTTRASHVEPCGRGWMADMAPIGGPILFASDGNAFKTRQAALDAERAYIRKELGL